MLFDHIDLAPSHRGAAMSDTKDLISRAYSD
jgi:hypothetical protein